MRPSTQEVKYDQFLAVMLTALGVMLAAVTLFVGLIPVFGYQFLRDEARKTATDVTKETVSDTMRRRRDRAQATGLSEGQAEEVPSSGLPASKRRTGAKLATSDKGLEKD